MLMPSIFGEDLFDNFMKDFPFFDDNAESNVEKKLYGRRGKNLMKTDIKETEGGYELEMDLPGFTKDEIKVSPHNAWSVGLFDKVFPAYAGMIPAFSSADSPHCCVPRIRGDDPTVCRYDCRYRSCSPHTRG